VEERDELHFLQHPHLGGIGIFDWRVPLSFLSPSSTPPPLGYLSGMRMQTEVPIEQREYVSQESGSGEARWPFVVIEVAGKLRGPAFPLRPDDAPK